MNALRKDITGIMAHFARHYNCVYSVKMSCCASVSQLLPLLNAFTGAVYTNDIVHAVMLNDCKSLSYLSLLLCNTDVVQCIYRNPQAESRPSFPEVQVALHRPDYELLTWTDKDMTAHTNEARTVGAALEDGEELFTELQKSYIKPI